LPVADEPIELAPEVEALAVDEPIELAPEVEALAVDEPVELAPAVEELPIEEPVELAPAVEELAVEEPVELAPEVEAVAVEAEPAAETVPALVPVMAAEPLDIAPLVEAPAEAVPFGETPLVPEMPAEAAELALAVESVAPAVALPRTEVPPAAEAIPFNGPVMQAEPVSLASLPPLEFSRARVPYLVAPSFLVRAGASTFVDGEATSVPTDSTLDCVLDGGVPRLHSSLEIPMSTRFAETAEISLHDSAPQGINEGTELQVQTSCIVPDARKHICESAWNPSDQPIGIEQTVVDAGWSSTRALDFDLPAPASLVVRPEAQGFGAVDPKKLPGVSPMDTAALMRDILKTHELGGEAPFIDPPTSAMEPGLRARLAPLPAPKPFPSAWQYRTSHCCLPSQLATWAMAPTLPMDSFPYEAECNKIDGIKMAPLPAPYSIYDQYRVAKWAQAEYEHAGMVGESGLIFNGLPMLPRRSALPPGRFETRTRGPVLSWEPSALAVKERAAAKILPIRDSAILPGAANWPRLESLPL
jgi:hypothetical protein